MKTRSCIVIRHNKEIPVELEDVKKGETFKLIPASPTDSSCPVGWYVASSDGFLIGTDNAGINIDNKNGFSFI